MKVLAIDPGYERLGIAVLEKEDGTTKEKLVFSECFKTLASDPHPLRLAQIQKRIEEVLKEYKPDDLSIETLFFNKNVKTALMVAEARGVIIATCKNFGCEVFEYSPQQIKTSVTGDGGSDKNSIIKMIPLLIKLEKEVKIDDEFDAIAAGICHISSKKVINR
ncbi:crossover junction endodeoxyribonuclease RuvC [Candidatus Parcubacteria bacterium]|nr:crossover junction endodeoxyribonuclease RuvC [Candidatus Parcubacteria bacterium]